MTALHPALAKALTTIIARGTCATQVADIAQSLPRFFMPHVCEVNRLSGPWAALRAAAMTVGCSAAQAPQQDALGGWSFFD